MATPEFKYQPMFEHGHDNTEYYLLTKDYVSVSEFEGKPILKIEKEGLTAMANAAFRDVSFMLRRSHNEQVAKILTDPEASDNDKYVALTFLRNAEVAAKGVLPFCQLKLQPREYFLSARIQVLLSSMVKKVSRYGLDTVMKKLCHLVFTRHIQKRTCAIHRTLLLQCTKK